MAASDPPLTTPNHGAADLSIVVLAHNHADYTARLLDSLRLAAPADAEVVLVDNGSADSTRAVFGRFASVHPRTRLALFGRNLGYSKGNNEGARASSGRHLVFLNNDMEARPGCFAPYVDLLTDPSVGAVGIKLLFPSGQIQHAGLGLGLFGHPVHRRFGAADEDVVEPPTVSVAAVTGACLGIRRDLFCALGGFCERYELLYQDVDLCFQVLARGLDVVYAPAAAMVHHESVTARPHKSAGLVDRDWHTLRSRWGAWFRALRPTSVERVAVPPGGDGVVVYGTGTLASRLAADLRGAGVVVRAFSDSRPAVWGTAFEGATVVPPAEIDAVTGAAVVVATMRDAEVRAHLRAQGVRARVVPSCLEWGTVRPLLAACGGSESGAHAAVGSEH